MDHTQVIAGAVECIEQMVVVDAGQGINGVKTVGDQRGDSRLCGGHGLHTPA
jgi:hypothetical protein